MAMRWPAAKSMLAEVRALSADTSWSNSLQSMVFAAMEWPALLSDGDKARTDCMADDGCRNCISICRCCSNRDCCSDAIDCNWASRMTDTLDMLAASSDGNRMVLDIRAVSV